MQNESCGRSTSAISAGQALASGAGATAAVDPEVTAVGGGGAAAVRDVVATAAVGSPDGIGGGDFVSDAGIVGLGAANAACAEGAIGAVSGTRDGPADRDPAVEAAPATGELEALEAARGVLALGSSATTWAV